MVDNAPAKTDSPNRLAAPTGQEIPAMDLRQGMLLVGGVRLSRRALEESEYFGVGREDDRGPVV